MLHIYYLFFIKIIILKSTVITKKNMNARLYSRYTPSTPFVFCFFFTLHISYVFTRMLATVIIITRMLSCYLIIKYCIVNILFLFL